jgi:phosphoribosyl 1,2-cyclic phosphate phosphodiesterase
VIEAIVLGSGTSNGVPTLGQSYSADFLANPKNHRTRSSILLAGPDGNLLVDCSPELRLQVTGQGITRIDAVLITHTHADHIMGMDDLRAVSKRPGGLPIYAQPSDQLVIRKVFDYAFREPAPGIAVPRFDLRDIPDLLEVGGMEVRTFLVDHGTTKVVGLRVQDFGYITDVSAILSAVRPMVLGLETLVIDAVRFAPHPNHFHYAKAIEVIADLAPRRAILTHLSDDYDHDRFSAQMPAGVELAYDGMRIAIDP